MSIMSWNYRDLGNLRAVLVLKDPIRTHKSIDIFLFETLVNISNIEEIRVKIGYDFFVLR